MLEKALNVPGMISLAAGFVDQESLPAEETAELVQAILSDPASQKACLQYGCTEGYLPLRRAILDYIGKSNGFAPADCLKILFLIVQFFFCFLRHSPN